MCWSSSRKCRIFFCAIEMHRKQNISAECESIAKYIWSLFLNFPLGNDHLTWRGGLWFSSKKIFWFPMLLKKNSDFGGGKKKKSDSELLSYNLMLNSGKTFCCIEYLEKTTDLSQVTDKLHHIMLYRVPGENHRPVASHWQTSSHNVV